MADINKQMAEFARELWENYIKPKFTAEFPDIVSYYMATVVSNDGNNRVTIKRPFDDAYQVSCLEDMAGLVAGDTVLVLRFGNGTNNANHIVFGRGNGNANYTAIGASEEASAASASATEAAKVATNYITTIGSNGVTVSGNNATANVQITNKVRVQADSTHFTDVESAGMKVYSGSAGVPVAQFLASGSRIATDGTHYTEFTANSWRIVGGSDSPTISAMTYPVTDSAVTSAAQLSISNAARTKNLITLFTNKVTYSGVTHESPTIMINAYDTGNAAILMTTGRNSDGATMGGSVSIRGLGTNYEVANLGIGTAVSGGVTSAFGNIRLSKCGSSSTTRLVDLTAHSMADSKPRLTFYDTDGSTALSWYGTNLAYIYREAGYAGYVAHGKSTDHKYTFEWSSIGSYNYLRFFVDATEVYRLQQQSYSDKRVKKDIEPIQSDYKDAVGAVDITQFRYDFKEGPLKNADGILFGVIAQDLIEELDDKGISYTDTPLVSDMGEDDESLYSVNYTQFLLARIAHDEDRIQKLEEQNKALEARLEAIEARLKAG